MAGPADADPAGASPRRRRRRALAEMAVTILVAVLLGGLVRAFAFQTFWIPSSSMVPALGVYDRIVVQKAFFSWRDVREGEIVVFSHPPPTTAPGRQATWSNASSRCRVRRSIPRATASTSMGGCSPSPTCRATTRSDRR